MNVRSNIREFFLIWSRQQQWRSILQASHPFPPGSTVPNRPFQKFRVWITNFIWFRNLDWCILGRWNCKRVGGVARRLALNGNRCQYCEKQLTVIVNSCPTPILNVAVYFDSSIRSPKNFYSILEPGRIRRLAFLNNAKFLVGGSKI